MRIRTYVDQPVFPRLFSMLRTGLVVQGTNFPAQVAKFIYDRFLQDVPRNKVAFVLDPSMGYGARYYAALASSSSRPIRYVGIDPNSEHWAAPDYSRYEALADHYRAAVRQRFYATIDALCCGSEAAHTLPTFQQYRGKVDLVFSSPPYFCAEIYSREETQSAIKFPTYDRWRDGFLAPTLTTCIEWLKPGGILAWNIADVKIRGRYVPLEQDSQTIIRGHGMHFVEKLKMPLATVTGGGKLIDGIPTTKNYLTLNGVQRKYEPIFVFRKPK